MEDYDNFCKLIQTSPYIDMNGWMMVEPADMPHQTVHLDLNLSNMLLCDKPFMGSPVSRQRLDGIEMAGILWGGKKNIMDKAVSVSLINSLSPLQFSDEMLGSLIELARHNQACVVASLIMAGGSGPVTLGGVLALQNAEILAGITLAQLVRPGAPVIYGSTSSAMDMKTGALSIGAPELSKTSIWWPRWPGSTTCPPDPGWTDRFPVHRCPGRSGIRSGALHGCHQRHQFHFACLRHPGLLHRHEL